MIYNATLDKASRAITVMFFVLFFIIAILPHFAAKSAGNQAYLLISIPFFVILSITYCFSIKSYQITENDVVINRPFDKVILDKSIIKNVSAIQNVNILLSIRSFGSGGMFGYFGIFWNKKFGKMTWYATRTNNVIIIETNLNKKILLTPNAHKKFFKELTASYNLDKGV